MSSIINLTKNDKNKTKPNDDQIPSIKSNILCSPISTLPTSHVLNCKPPIGLAINLSSPFELEVSEIKSIVNYLDEKHGQKYKVRIKTLQQMVHSMNAAQVKETAINDAAAQIKTVVSCADQKLYNEVRSETASALQLTLTYRPS